MALKVANLILAHKSPEQLVRLIRRLHTPDRAFVVHLDKKSQGPEWDRVVAELKELDVLWAGRVTCSWGKFSQVEATLNCISKLRESGISWDFVNLLSGQDYPIRPNEHLEDHLNAHRGECLMEFQPFPYPNWDFNGYYRLPTWHIPARGGIGALFPKDSPTACIREFH
jgi:hypothetical protein